MRFVTLGRGIHDGIQVRPRWPARHVRVDAVVLSKLQSIQAQLPSEITLILTRGYEPRASHLGFVRMWFRTLGIGVFRRLYPDRQHEIADIFGSNGHDVDGTHIDVSFCLNGRRIRMLPLGVFTPSSWQHRRVQRYASPLNFILTSLKRNGFRVHHNETESLQIHCDLIPATK
ncbi:hypothetical protein [Pandoraea horticolens]|uniref:hypothetical protein n=1 Tax=Pandoraea horticolens TaxID=2508298 RepID=UPI001240DDCD|nr:hypothetical protein [Pandoraea horticolens]